jgi:uncharacterized protein YihD (DUF1040 family)
METRKEYLEKQYSLFTNELIEIIGENIFPSLEDVDIIDILTYFQMTFGSTTEYEEIVKSVIKYHVNITDDQFIKIYPIIEKYINELKNFLKTN